MEGELGPLEVGEVVGVSACSSTNSFNIFCRWNTSLVFSTGSRFSCATGLIKCYIMFALVISHPTKTLNTLLNLGGFAKMYA